MHNNDILRRLRFLLKITNPKLAQWVSTPDYSVSLDDLERYLAREEDEHFAPCPDELLARFLDAVVTFKRGASAEATPRPPELPITNNQVLKKLRVAFALKDHQVQALMESVGFRVSKSELNALFRKPDQGNYRECGDQFLRQFLKALTLQERPDLQQ